MSEATVLAELVANKWQHLRRVALNEPEFENEAELGVGVLVAAVDTADELDEVIATACDDGADETRR